MELKELILRGIDFLKAEPIITVVIIGIIVILFCFRKKAMLRIVAILLVLALVYYLLTLFGVMTSSGVSQKGTLIEKSQQ